MSRRALGATPRGVAAAGVVPRDITRRDTYRTYCGTLPMMGVPNDLPAAQTGFVFDPARRSLLELPRLDRLRDRRSCSLG